MDNQQPARKFFSKQEAHLKAESFCAYQERSQHEIRLKLLSWGLNLEDADQIITELIGESFLNEERFALAYTLGKFRIKGWGKIKIKQGLKFKQVPEKLIRKSLLQINDDDYLECLKNLLEKKSRLLTEKDPLKRKYKLLYYAGSRGFEKDLIFDILNNNTLS